MTACGDSTSPTPPEQPSLPEPQAPPEPMLSTDVVRTVTEGPAIMTFLSADPSPGSTLSGCGTSVEGCEGRIRVRVRVETSTGGNIVDLSAYLYGTERRIACLISRDTLGGSFELRAGQPREFEFLFDRSDDCPTPEKIRAMNVISSADVNASGRQGWLIEYGLEP